MEAAAERASSGGGSGDWPKAGQAKARVTKSKPPEGGSAPRAVTPRGTRHGTTMVSPGFSMTFWLTSLPSASFL